MVGGAALALRAVRTDKLLPLIGSAVLFGFAFNTKMLQGYIALPAVFAVYLYASKLGWKKKRPSTSPSATVALAVSSFWWATAVVPGPRRRPALHRRLDRRHRLEPDHGLQRPRPGLRRRGQRRRRRGGGGSFAGTAGLGRMFNDILGGQISWLIPFAVDRARRRPGPARPGPAHRRERAALVLWGGWLVLHYLTFAMAEGTMHPYYTTALAPGIAALTGAGGVCCGAPSAAVTPVVLGAAGRRRGHRHLGDRAAAPGLRLEHLAVAGRRRGHGPRDRGPVRLRIGAPAPGPAARRPRALRSSRPSRVRRRTPPRRPAPTRSRRRAWATAPTRRPVRRPAAAWAVPAAVAAGAASAAATAVVPATGRAAPSRAARRTGSSPAAATARCSRVAAAVSCRRAARPVARTGSPAAAPAASPRSAAARLPAAPATRCGTGGRRRHGGGGGMGGSVDSQLISYLEKHQDGAKWLLAVSNSQSAAS